MPRPSDSSSPRPRSPRAAGRRYPGSAAELCELDHRNPYELLVATILSAQSTDKMINSVTPTLFERFPDAAALAGADEGELQEMIRSTGSSTRSRAACWGWRGRSSSATAARSRAR